MDEVGRTSSLWTHCIIACRCHTGPIFIRAGYGTSHGQNNISMALTGMWRQDEFGIKIKANEYKWCSLHPEEGINHTWANVFSLSPPPPLSLCCSFFISLFFCCASLHLIKAASLCVPPVRCGRMRRCCCKQAFTSRGQATLFPPLFANYLAGNIWILIGRNSLSGRGQSREAETFSCSLFPLRLNNNRDFQHGSVNRLLASLCDKFMCWNV